MNDKTYLFTEEQLRVFLEDALVGVNQHIYLKSHQWAYQFLRELDIDEVYAEVIENYG